MNESEWELEFESWEDHYDLHEARDYPSLVVLFLLISTVPPSCQIHPCP